MANPVKAGDIFDNVRSLMNDQDGDVYDDTILLPYLKMANIDLRLENEDSNIPVTNATSDAISIPAGTLGIGGLDQPALPADLIEIVEMYERTAGTTNDFMRMRRKIFDPKTEVQTTYLQIYTWRGQKVHFIGATTDLEVKIDYISQTGEINDKNTMILIYNSCAFLWYRTAALAAFYIDENKTRSDELNAEAGRCIETMESISIKSQQNMVIRRRPFMSNYRQRGWQGYGR
jgi:hypothetical protein